MSEKPPAPSEPFIDVDRLVVDLRARVERERAAGRYTDDVDSLELRAVDDDADAAAESPRSAAPPTPPQVRYRPELGYSSRKLIGPLLSGFKRLFYRLFHYPLEDLARQTDDAVHELHAADQRSEHALAQIAERLELLARERRELGQRVDTLVNQLELVDQLEARARERVEVDVQSLAVRLAETEATLERLQVPSRLGRLERLVRTAPQARPAATAPSPSPSPAPQMPSFDYMTFENRFRPEGSVRERQAAYVDDLRDRKRVVDLGCGRGELLALLRDAGVSAYGVDLDEDVVAIGKEQGLDVTGGDAIAHVETLESGAVDGIVASHVVEHLTPDQLWRLIASAAEALAPGGILILETPNPESILAGSVNFHRDPTHVRPVHPDTLSFLCESAGFSNVEIRRLSPVPANERLPQPSSGDEPLSQVVNRLNEFLYGYQDYAVVARS
jgi:SAM-dependent methyltransferase